MVPSSAKIRLLYASARTWASPAYPTRPSNVATSSEILSSKYSLNCREYRAAADPVPVVAGSPGDAAATVDECRRSGLPAPVHAGPFGDVTAPPTASRTASSAFSRAATTSRARAASVSGASVSRAASSAWSAPCTWSRLSAVSSSAASASVSPGSSNRAPASPSRVSRSVSIQPAISSLVTARRDSRGRVTICPTAQTALTSTPSAIALTSPGLISTLSPRPKATVVTHSVSAAGRPDIVKPEKDGRDAARCTAGRVPPCLRQRCLTGCPSRTRRSGSRAIRPFCS